MELRQPLPDARAVHVWFVELAANAAADEACSRSLSADERERAARFRGARLTRAFVLSRGVLRALLGRYLAIEPDRVRFAYGARGKPRVAFPPTPLEFNVAHSGRFAAYAFAAGCELGVDIEQLRPTRDQEAIVRRYFSAEECKEWMDLDAARRDEAFFRCWTRKEAYLKALGDGLALPLDSFRVSLRPEVPAALIHVAGDPTAASKWSLWSLAPEEGYAGALAAPQRGLGVRAMPRLTAAAVLDLVSGPGPFPPAADELGLRP